MAKLPLEIKSGVIVLPVLFAGKRGAKILKMVLDTGASITTMPAEMAIAIGGCDPAKPKKRIEMITASGIEYVPVVIVPKLEFLGFVIKNVEVACLSIPPQSAVSGLLGLNVLRDFDLSFKFRTKILEITK